MKNHAKNKLTAVIACCFLSTNAISATDVNIKSDFKSGFTELDIKVEVSEHTKYKARIKDNVVNRDFLLNFGNVDGSPLSLTKKGEYKGECVAFIKAISDAKETSKWTGSQRVIKHKKLPRFTPIATLTAKKSNGKKGYDGYDGKSHVALYLGHYKNGIFVMDQNYYEKGALAIHYIPFSGNNQNNAGNYYVLEQD